MLTWFKKFRFTVYPDTPCIFPFLQIARQIGVWVQFVGRKFWCDELHGYFMSFLKITRFGRILWPNQVKASTTLWRDLAMCWNALKLYNMASRIYERACSARTIDLAIDRMIQLINKFLYYLYWSLILRANFNISYTVIWLNLICCIL